MPQIIVDWAQVLGTALSLLALVVALYALWKQKRDIARERMRQHLLEGLRILNALLGESDVDEKAVHRHLATLPSGAMPITRWVFGGTYMFEDDIGKVGRIAASYDHDFRESYEEKQKMETAALQTSGKQEARYLEKGDFFSPGIWEEYNKLSSHYIRLLRYFILNIPVNPYQLREVVKRMDQYLDYNFNEMTVAQAEVQVAINQLLEP